MIITSHKDTAHSFVCIYTCLNNCIVCFQPHLKCYKCPLYYLMCKIINKKILLTVFFYCFISTNYCFFGYNTSNELRLNTAGFIPFGWLTILCILNSWFAQWLIACSVFVGLQVQTQANFNKFCPVKNSWPNHNKCALGFNGAFWKIVCLR